MRLLVFSAILLFYQQGAQGALHGRRSSWQKLQQSGHGPRFQFTKQNISVGPGDRAVLKCRVENLGTKTVTWRKATYNYPLTVGLHTFVGDTRVSVDYNQRTSEWSLIIQDVRPDDEGEYFCQISTKSLRTRKEYSINLNVRTVQVKGTEFVELGKSVNIVCNASGRPDPPRDVEWFRNGVKLGADKTATGAAAAAAAKFLTVTKQISSKFLVSTLLVRPARLDDSGTYVCRSTNMDAGSVNVTVLDISSRGSSRREASAGSQLGIRSTQTSTHSTGRALCVLLLLHLLHLH